MPTVVLLDISLSMRRPVSKTNQDETRHDLACKGLEWFFDYFGRCFPCEYTSLLTFSSSCQTLVPFTRDYKQLKDKLADILFHDRTDMFAALTTMIDIVVGEWGAFAPCQIVVVTDGSPGVRHQDLFHHKQLLSIPFSCQLNVVCIATQEELTDSSFVKSSMQRLCETAAITPAEVFIPTENLSTESVRTAFKQLTKVCFRPFVSVLKCGHLQSRVTLTPPPAMHRAKYDIIINPELKFPKIEENLGNVQFPREMVVCGFLDSSCIPAPPHYSRHFVLDPEMEEKNSERESSVLSLNAVNTDDKQAMAAGVVSSAAEEAQRPSFRVLLHGSLKCESKTALMKLG